MLFYPIDQAIPFAYSCVVFLQYTQNINMACLIEGSKAVKMLKNIIKVHYSLFLHKPVA